MTFNRLQLLILLLSSFTCIATASIESTQPILSHLSTAQPVWAKNGMVASQEKIATQIGVEILKQGGNAVDAAVAVGFALAVTHPQAGNLGGGGFMLIHTTQKKLTTAIDYREKAPSQAHKNMFLDEQGKVNQQLSRFHGLAIGVPGSVAGLEYALMNYGTMPLESVITPAIKLAQNGFTISYELANSLKKAQTRLSRWSDTKDIFLKANGHSYQAGDKLIQPELAQTLKQIAKEGKNGFYQGYIAQQIANSVQGAGGIMTIDDLANYQVIERKAISTDYRGYQVFSMPPPSSGGVHIAQILNTLENFPLSQLGHNTADTIHLMAEVMKFAYADRSQYLGDPDFYPVPVAKLTDKDYAKQLAENISLNKVTPSKDIAAGQYLVKESPQTTHYSIIDKWGNAVSNTYTLNFSYGSGLVAKGTGILLNNQMDDFSAKAGVPNAYGLIGAEANAVAANKRPLSSMSPTIVLKDNQPWLITGSPGGSRIISTSVQILLNTIEHGLNVAEATHAPRIHHQWLPDELRVENHLNKDTIRLLQAKGHKVKIKAAMGATQTIMRTDAGLYGASDPRKGNAVTAGY